MVVIFFFIIFCLSLALSAWLYYVVLVLLNDNNNDNNNNNNNDNANNDNNLLLVMIFLFSYMFGIALLLFLFFYYYYHHHHYLVYKCKVFLVLHYGFSTPQQHCIPCSEHRAMVSSPREPSLLLQVSGSLVRAGRGDRVGEPAGDAGPVWRGSVCIQSGQVMKEYCMQ